jgi:predicted dehydrogenase
MRNYSLEPFRVAVIGCGAISVTGHLPALRLTPEIKLVYIVDTNKERAKTSADEFGATHYSTNYTDIIGKVDGAIIATPPGGHEEIACRLLSNGIHVLVEKPMANTAESCQKMGQAANSANKTLAIGMIRRYYWADRFIKDAISSGVLGDIIEFKFENGYPFAWPSVSPFILSRKEAGGGVLMGLGSHVLDTLMWWFGKPLKTEIWTDARGGLDSECLLQVQIASGGTGTVELSRSRQLSNSVSISGTKGNIYAPFYGNKVEITLKPSGITLEGVAVDQDAIFGMDQDVPSVMAIQIRDWVNASIEGRPPAATADEVTTSIQLIEELYAKQQLMDLPWTKV